MLIFNCAESISKLISRKIFLSCSLHTIITSLCLTQHSDKGLPSVSPVLQRARLFKWPMSYSVFSSFTLMSTHGATESEPLLPLTLFFPSPIACIGGSLEALFMGTVGREKEVNMFLIGKKADVTCDKMCPPVSAAKPTFRISSLLFLSCIKISHRKSPELESGLLGFTVTWLLKAGFGSTAACIMCTVAMMICHCSNHHKRESWLSWAADEENPLLRKFKNLPYGRIWLRLFMGWNPCCLHWTWLWTQQVTEPFPISVSSMVKQGQ